MMYRKILQIAGVLLLVLLFSFSFVPVLAKSYTINNEVSAPVALTSLADEGQSLAVRSTNVLTEVVERRTATSKHYQLGEHLYQATISAVPLHYQVADGTWQEINTTPIANADGSYQVIDSDIKMVFPSTLGQGGVAVDATVYLQASKPLAISNHSTPPVINGKPDLTKLIQSDLSALQLPEPPTPVQLSLQWQPQSLTVINNTGAVSTYAQFNSATASATKNSVVYTQGTAEAIFYPYATGFEQTLRLATSPAGLAQDATGLAYTAHINLPAGVQLSQNGSFTADRLELLDSSGKLLLVLPTPYLSDQSGIRQQSQYQVETDATGFKLTIELPLVWLNDPARQYPVMAVSGIVGINALFADGSYAFQQAGAMWECKPTDTSTTVGDFMGVGNRTSGSCSAGIERSLAQWAIDALPLNAVVAFPKGSVGLSILEGDVKSQLWTFPVSATNSSAISISTYRMLVPWTATAMSWQTRTVTSTWNTAGGSSSDYLAASEDTVAVSAQGVPRYVDMGSLHSLIGAWQTNKIFFKTIGACPTADICWGTPNYGVMYRSTSENTGADLDRVFARGLVLSTTPVLTVTYFDNTLSLPANQEFLVPRAPSPDYYQVAVPASNWTALAIQPVDSRVRSDYDLVLSSQGGNNNITSSLLSIVKVSQRRGNSPDFIALTGGVSTTLYPWVIQYEGTGAYYIKHVTVSKPLTVSTSAVISVGSKSLIELYELTMQVSTTYRINLANAASNNSADLSLVLFKPGSGTAYAIQDAVATANSGSFGEEETINYTPTESGVFGLVVVNNALGSSSGTSLFSLSFNQDTLPVNLPLILKNYPQPPPLSNPDFELGTLEGWNSVNPGGPLVASAVSNPDSSCFGGSFTAQVGTPSTSSDFLTNIPVDKEVSIEQKFGVPSSATRLTFKYKVSSFDIVKDTKGQVFDYFRVTLDGTAAMADVGNPAGSLVSGSLVQWDSGCQSASLDVTAYAGGAVTLRFLVRNGVYNDRNSWAYVDDVVFQ